MTGPIDHFIAGQLNQSDPASNAGAAQQIAAIAQNADDTSVRQGRVISFDGSSITVAISGSPTLVNATYLMSYQPALGDLVNVIRSGASWLVLGCAIGMPVNNALANGSFEVNGSGNLSPWTFVVIQNTAGNPTGTTQDMTGFVPNGQLVAGRFAAFCSINTNGVGSDSEGVFRSEPVPVAPGETWVGMASRHIEMNAAFWRVSGGNAIQPAVQAFVSVSFYTNAAQAEPGAAQFISNPQLPPIGTEPGWNTIQTPAAVVPAGCTVARLVLDFAVSDFIVNTYACYWDRAILRKITNSDGSAVLG